LRCASVSLQFFLEERYCLIEQLERSSTASSQARLNFVDRRTMTPPFSSMATKETPPGRQLSLIWALDFSTRSGVLRSTGTRGATSIRAKSLRHLLAEPPEF
jgi:hypothetical protein